MSLTLGGPEEGEDEEHSHQARNRQDHPQGAPGQPPPHRLHRRRHRGGPTPGGRAGRRRPHGLLLTLPQGRGVHRLWAGRMARHEGGKGA